MTLVTLTLRVVSCLFITAREHLKLQLEWLLDWIMSRINNGLVCWDVDDLTPSSIGLTSPETRSLTSRGDHRHSTNSTLSTLSSVVVVAEIRELLLETLIHFLRIPSFAAELYVNYDGNLKSRNFFEEIIKFLCKVYI